MQFGDFSVGDLTCFNEPFKIQIFDLYNAQMVFILKT